MPPRLNREQRAVTRVLQLCLWVLQRGAEGFTFADVREAFPGAYRTSAQGERQWTRDKTQLRRMGFRLRKSARGVYALDRDASRARSLRLTPAEVAVLDAASAFLPSVTFPDAAHHVRTALRKIVLSGVPLRASPAERAAATRDAWEDASSQVPDLSWQVASGPGAVVEIVYRDPESGRETKHRVEVRRVFLGNKVIVGRVLPGGETRTFLGACVKSLRNAPGVRNDSARVMSGYPSLVEGLGFELSRKWNAFAEPEARPNVTSAQRRLALAYLLLNALIEASPASIPWNEAMRLAGAKTRAELDGVVQVLEEGTFPGLGEQVGFLALERSDDGIGLYLRHDGIPRLALRPVEVAMLLGVARATSPDARALSSLSRKLLAVLAEEERKYAAHLAATFDFGSAP